VAKNLVGDSTRIRQILFNLVSNAYKFTERGSISITMSRQRLSNQYRISVEDTGEGISANAVSNLFMPYYQSKVSTSREHGGTGLGLSICRQLCELMDGEIGVSSLEGKGSTFWINLPLEHVSISDNKEQTQTGLEKVGAGERPLHVLVAEDNIVNQIVAKGMLSTLGHTCQTVDNGIAAVELLENDNQQFDLVLMDCEMPEMDGLAATKLIRQFSHCQALPIVALTAHAMGYQPQKCLEAGMNHYIAKPLKLDELQRVISRAATREAAV